MTNAISTELTNHLATVKELSKNKNIPAEAMTLLDDACHTYQYGINIIEEDVHGALRFLMRGCQDEARAFAVIFATGDGNE